MLIGIDRSLYRWPLEGSVPNSTGQSQVLSLNTWNAVGTRPERVLHVISLSRARTNNYPPYTLIGLTCLPNSIAPLFYLHEMLRLKILGLRYFPPFSIESCLCMLKPEKALFQILQHSGREYTAQYVVTTASSQPLCIYSKGKHVKKSQN